MGFDPTKKERRTWGKPLGGVLGPDSATKPSKIEVFWLQLGGFSPVAYTENPRPRVLPCEDKKGVFVREDELAYGHQSKQLRSPAADIHG